MKRPVKWGFKIAKMNNNGKWLAGKSENIIIKYNEKKKNSKTF